MGSLNLSMKSKFYTNILNITFACFLMMFMSCSSQEEREEEKLKKMACDCVEEFNAYRFYSELGEACMDYAIAKGKTDNPYGYFQDLCDN